MKHIKNDIADIHGAEDILPTLMKFFEIVRRHPSCLDSCRGMKEGVRSVFSEGGFQLYPTVKKTTLMYDPAADSFLKILHPLNMKSRLLFLFADKAGAIYHVSEKLLSEGVKITGVIAYGSLKKGRRPFFVMKRVEGESLYDILIRQKKELPVDACFRALSEVAKIHRLGYWLGDAHLSHIFIRGTEVSGFIDIDSIRRNRPFRLKNLAKDIAGLNHPELPLKDDEKKALIQHYIQKANVRDQDDFLKLLNFYTERRWKG
ncbi:MAG: hypothetical protein C4538_02410 [Nitrospiraceae bacterium]|nr:MAG: hypothetical protein C4538_02410 [Nitrospiraceae bacterium]